jgi:hypothetical protein
MLRGDLLHRGMQTLDTLTSALNQGGPHLGDLIWWTLARGPLDRSTLENIWARAQLAPEHLPDPATAEKALKAAVREAAVGQPDRLIRIGQGAEGEGVQVQEQLHHRGRVPLVRRS